MSETLCRLKRKADKEPPTVMMLVPPFYIFNKCSHSLNGVQPHHQFGLTILHHMRAATREASGVLMLLTCNLFR
eukprot:scaffold153642_cov18-Tisochrysis_lutea.AAC.1